MRPPGEILLIARGRAHEAARAADALLPPEGVRGFDCGFAWVVVKPARGPFITWCRNSAKAAHRDIASQFGHLRDYGGGGWEFWCTGFHKTQSISVHRAAAEAFAKVLVENGISAEVGSRLD